MYKPARISVAILIISFCVLLGSCEKKQVPVLETSEISDITGTTATSGGTITDEGSSTIISRGVCWSTGTSPTIANNKTSDGAGAGTFTSNLTDLNGATKYFVRAYATNSVGTGYGMAMSLTTLGQVPTTTISAVSNITTAGAILNGSVNANFLLTVVTFEYGTSTSYGQSIIATQSPVTGNTISSVSEPITGLTAGTTYHIRIKAVNSLGTTYSSDVTFITMGQAPIISTEVATNITAETAQLNGTVNANYLSTVVTFEYGTTTSYGSTITATQSPIIGNSITNVSANITGLSAGITYHFRAKAANSLGTTNGNDITFVYTITDVTGNIYRTITMGSQIWMAENLKTTKYNDGEAIPHVTGNTDWDNLTTAAYCWYNNDESTNRNTYGALYNWFTVNQGKLCPAGWHIPSDAEWTTLTTFMGGESVAGGKLKETGISHWLSPNAGATNETGFTALPGGNRNFDGTFANINNYGFWWSSTEHSILNHANYLDMSFNYSNVDRNNHEMRNGFSVRCIKD